MAAAAEAPPPSLPSSSAAVHDELSPPPCTRRYLRLRSISHRLAPLILATAATASTLLIAAMAPPHHAASRGGAAAGVAFQRPQPLWRQHQPQYVGHQTQEHQHAAPVVISLKASSSSGEEGETGMRKRRRWWSLSGVLNKAQAVAASDDFKVLARGARTVLRELMEVDVGAVDVEESMARLRRGVDRALTRTVMSLEGLLQMYEGRSQSTEGVLGRVRRRIAKMVQGGLGKLMTEDGIQYCLYSVNMTALMVEEMAARRTADARKALGLADSDGEDEPLPRAVMGQVQRDVMREMVVVAEDAEAFAAAVVNSRWFRRSYCSDDAEAAQYANLLKTKLVSRLVLAVAAGVLHGYKPAEDPLLALLVVAYASGSLTRQVAANFLGLVGTALTSPTADAAAPDVEGAMSAAQVKAGDYVIARLPDVWSAADSPEDIGEGLFRLFQALERRKALSLAKRAGDSLCPVVETEAAPTYLATAAMETAATNPAASQLAALAGGGGTTMDASGGGNSEGMAWAARPGSQAAAAGAAAFLPPLVFTHSQQGSRLLLLAKSIGAVRRYWKATTAAALMTAALVWLARWFIASPATSSSVRFGSSEGDEEEERRLRDLDAAISAGALRDGEG